MKKIFALLTLLFVGSCVFAKQYVKSGRHFIFNASKVAKDCKELIEQGFNIDCVTIQYGGGYIIIYSDKK